MHIIIIGLAVIGGIVVGLSLLAGVAMALMGGD